VKRKTFIMIIISVFFSVISLAAEEKEMGIINVDNEQAKNLIYENMENDEFIILDIRTPEEFKSLHIDSAVNLDFYSNTFITDIDKLGKDKIYLVYCRSGRRSGITVNKMIEMGFKNIYHLHYGFMNW